MANTEFSVTLHAMGNTPPEDIEREVTRLWAKVGPGSDALLDFLAPSFAPAPSSTEPINSVAWETIELLKSQQRRQTDEWAQLLEAKERALQVSRERQAGMERELAELRRRVADHEESAIEHGLSVQTQLDAALKALDHEKGRYEQEIAALMDLLEQARSQLGDETLRRKQSEKQAQEDLKQSVHETKDLRQLADRRQEELRRAEESTRALSEGLKEAKNALEKTLSELLLERRARAEAEADQRKALRKVDDVEKHFEELSKIWEAERAQWRELWDRERSAWETQKTELSSWEQTLRTEREAWHADLKSKEQDQMKFTESMTATLRESSEASAKMSEAMKTMAQQPQAAIIVARQPTPFAWKRWGVIVAATIVAVVAGVGSYDYSRHLHLKSLSVSPLAADNPTGLAFDGRRVLVTQWDGRLLSFDAKDLRTAPAITALKATAPYHPVSLALGGDILWSLDSAQARLIAHRAAAPEEIISIKPTPGPAPTALAFDGAALWSYDAANKALYRYESSGDGYKTYALAADVVPTSMQWVGGRLWVFDAKSHGLLIYDFKDDALKLRSRSRMEENVLGMAVYDKTLRILAGPSASRPADAVVTYRY